MLDETTLKGRLLAAALRLAADKPWREVTLLEIAQAAGSSLADVKPIAASKTDLVLAFVEAIDSEMLRKASGGEESQAPRDRLFEVVMSRFDAMQPHKAALRSILADAQPDPRLARSALASQRWMLNAAGIDADGPRGVVRIAGLASVYASVLGVWLDDEDPGLARTMAALDRRLRRGEQSLAVIDGLLGGLHRLGEMVAGRARRAGTAAAPPPASGMQPPPTAM